MRTVRIDAAKLNELRHFAEVQMGLDVPEGAKIVQIRALLQQAGYTKDTIEVDDDVLVPATKPEAAAASGKTKIIVATQEGPGGDRPIFVSVNDRPMYVPRGEVVEIPNEFVHVLSNAKQIVYEATDAQGLGRAREVLTYPFQIVG
jgi:hypothetical protein